MACTSQVVPEAVDLGDSFRPQQSTTQTTHNGHTPGADSAGPGPAEWSQPGLTAPQPGWGQSSMANKNHSSASTGGAHSPQGCPWNAQVGGPGRPQRWALRTLLHKATLPRPGRSSSTYPTEANTGQRPEPGDKETGPSARRAPTSQKITKRMETSNRPGAEVRTLVIKMLRDLRGEKSFV